MRRRWLHSSFVWLLRPPPPADPTAVHIKKVTGSLDQQKHDLTVGDNLSQNEAIEVASDALGELKLRDDTKLRSAPIVGASSSTSSSTTPRPRPAPLVSMAVKGAFRFITGLSSKGNYELRTPSAVISVRGTVFDVYVDQAGGTWLLLLEGSVRVSQTRQTSVPMSSSAASCTSRPRARSTARRMARTDATD